MILKILNSALILVAVFMGFKQGYAMFSGKPEMLEMFSKWNFSKTAVMINGAVTMIAALLILFPKTFVWGNFLMAAGILMIICLPPAPARIPLPRSRANPFAWFYNLKH